MWNYAMLKCIYINDNTRKYSFYDHKNVCQSKNFEKIEKEIALL